MSDVLRETLSALWEWVSHGDILSIPVPDALGAQVLKVLDATEDTDMRRTVLAEVHDPHADGFDAENDVPMPLQRELLRASVHTGMSFYWLCAIYRQGRIDAEREFLFRPGGPQ